MNPLVRFLTLGLASCFYLTYPLVKWARARQWRWTGAGLIGTLAGLATIRFLPVEPVAGCMVLVGAVFLSIAVSDYAEESLGIKDDQRIVIDEWAGYFVSMAFLPQTPWILASAFILFRIVDVSKPLGIDRLGNLPGGWGVVMDDVAGGLIVNVLLHLIVRR